ncbi:MAG: response regulator [Bradyrhizobiaceae bacterium]|nr:MAG: response regulator [Bradyrhizobiaceae bacterium]
MATFLKRRTLIILLVALGLLIGALAASAIIFFQQAKDQAAIQHTLAVKNRLSDILSLLQDAETGQRGFLLTERMEYLAPYEGAVRQFREQIEEVGSEIADNPVQIQSLATLRLLANDKLEELRQTIQLTQGGQKDEALALVVSDKGLTLMDNARKAIQRMQYEESRLLLERSANSKLTFRLAEIGIASSLLFTIILGWVAVTDAGRQFREVSLANANLAEAHKKTLEAVARRDKLESQLRQSQKMEAVGQLTGGIAHDFNNMLAVVIGSLNLLKRRLERGENNVGRFVDSALDGAERAATLTHRLLAFSRQQPLAPQSIDANKFVAGMADLIRRTLGETIQVETVLAGGLWRTHADPSQLESAILNLAVNARDAMPEGGRLTIETSNASLDDAYSAAHLEVPAGQYVLVSVTDTGVGMAPGIIDKAFEPFFTTKGVGQGTGLGLSQVQGFVKQSGGHIKIYSEVGHGTAVKIYLPRFFGETEILPDEMSSEGLPLGQSSEVVLVVEDEERMLRVSAEAFKELGYTVLQAGSPGAALRIIEQHPEIRLLFTDVVMPEMSGKTLADQATAKLPNLKVLFTTGFSRNAVIHNNVLDPGVNFLPKPFTVLQLAQKVRSVLDSDSS